MIQHCSATLTLQQTLENYIKQDPLLSTYEGMIPGISSGVTLTDNQLPWIADLITKGYDPLIESVLPFLILFQTIPEQRDVEQHLRLQSTQIKTVMWLF